MTTPDCRDHTTRRLEYPFSYELEEIDFKHKIMKMIEDFKQDVKNSFKEMEKTNKKVEEMSKSLKDTHENKKKKHSNR